jgi:hypothetical protein
VPLLKGKAEGHWKVKREKWKAKREKWKAKREKDYNEV